MIDGSEYIRGYLREQKEIREKRRELVEVLGRVLGERARELLLGMGYIWPSDFVVTDVGKTDDGSYIEISFI